MLVPGLLPFVDAQGEVAIKGGGPLKTGYGGIKANHEPFRVSPGG